MASRSQSCSGTLGRWRVRRIWASRISASRPQLMESSSMLQLSVNLNPDFYVGSRGSRLSSEVGRQSPSLPTSLHSGGAHIRAMGDEELPDFDEVGASEGGNGDTKDLGIRGGGSISASGFRDFLLKQELLQGIIECGFEHPSEVQHACIPQAILNTDILCQAKSGMGKTAVFVLACLHTIDLSEQVVRVLVLCHTRELAFQIQHEFMRLGKHLPKLKVAAVFGGSPVDADKKLLKSDCPHILVGTPGRVLQLMRDNGSLSLTSLTHFVLDECDKCIDSLSLRRDVQQVFIKTPKKKQVMMFSATMSAETRIICQKFMHNPHEITVESEAKLTLHGLLQYYVKLEERQKNKKLTDLLDALEFNQVVIFVKTVKRALALDSLLNECRFPSMTLHQLPAALSKKAAAGDTVKPSDSRIDRLKAFKDFKKRILVVTDLFGRGMDVERPTLRPKESSSCSRFWALTGDRTT